MKRVVNICCLMLLSISAFAQTDYYVLFEYDKYEVPDTAMAKLIKTIYTNEISKIYLEGHCDSIGSADYNYALSERRVKAVEKLLTDNGFDKNKIIGKVGFGKDRPLLPNSSDEYRQLNRRVYVKFDITKPLLAKEPALTNLKVRSTGEPLIVNEKKELGIALENFKVQNITDQPTVKAKDFKRENFTANNIISLPNLLFEGGRHVLVRGSISTLDTLFDILQEKPNLKVEIQGHVCCTTSQADGYDWDTGTEDLSWQRARAIKNILVKKGISSLRIQIRGFGGKRKLFPKEENEFQQAQNRRVEVLVLPDNQ